MLMTPSSTFESLRDFSPVQSVSKFVHNISDWLKTYDKPLFLVQNVQDISI